MPDIGDDLALADMAANMQAGRIAAHMAIGGRVLRCVLDADIVAVTRGGPDHLYYAIACGIDGRADWGAEIDALMHHAVAQDRIDAHAEAGGDLGAVDGRAQQGLADRVALRIEPIVTAVRQRVVIKLKLACRSR